MEDLVSAKEKTCQMGYRRYSLGPIELSPKSMIVKPIGDGTVKVDEQTGGDNYMC